jgi:hypothetical protein
MKIDTSLLGIWRCCEDSDTKNAIIVQCYDDLFGDIEKQYGSLDSYSKTLMNDPFASDVKTKGYTYYFTASFKGAQYMLINGFLSAIGDRRFLNIYYRHLQFDKDDNLLGEKEEGYFFLRIISAAKDSLTAAIVTDTMLMHLNSPEQLRAHLTKNIDKPGLYRDTLHLYKISRYHYDLDIAIRIKNEYLEALEKNGIKRQP